MGAAKSSSLYGDLIKFTDPRSNPPNAPLLMALSLYLFEAEAVVLADPFTSRNVDAVLSLSFFDKS